MVRNIIIAIIAIVVLYFILVFVGVIGGDDEVDVVEEPVVEEPATE